MNRTSRRGIALAVLLVGLTSWATLALPSFSDRNIAAGNLNPTDTILVMEIRVTRGGGEDVTLASITIRNRGTAGDGDIEKIILEDGGAQLAQSANLSGITSSNGVTIPLSYHLDNTTHYIRILVVIGTNVEGGETIDLQALVDYTSNGTPGTSVWISDLSSETIRDGGFDEETDNSPDAAFLNPTDRAIVQTAVFADDDANGSPVGWRGEGATTIVQVENIGTATGGAAGDIDWVRVTLSFGGNDYNTGWVVWDPASPQDFHYADFVGMPAGAQIADDDGVTVTVEMEVNDKANVIDGRTVRTKTTLRVREQGEGPDGQLVNHDHTITAGTVQTIRQQGFEAIEDESETLDSGAAATGDVVVQTVRAFDDDSNAKDVRITHFYVRNTGSADGAEIEKIEVKAGAQTLVTLTGGELATFKTGDWHAVDTVFDVPDDGEQVLKIYYTIGIPNDGHTLAPQVRFGAEEAPGGPRFNSDAATYPDELGLYEPGFEFVENMTPPDGGAAYSGQWLPAQKIRLEDRDEDDDDVSIDPVVVRNAGNASGNPDVSRIRVWREDAAGLTKIGESADLSGFTTGGIHIDIENDAIVQDSAEGTEIFLWVYLLIAEPEVMIAGRTIQLETRVIHTENGATFDKMVVSNQWVLETNHRPVVDFTFSKVATASIGPMADFTYADTIQFSGTATDPDGDAIASWRWTFGDGATANTQNATHQYPNGGTFQVTLTVTDEHGVTGSKTKTITVEGPPNEPPTIDEVTADPENPAVDQNVQFAATVTDPDQPAGTAFGYVWDFDDEETSTLAAPTHSYDEAGTFTVTLTVTDAQGATDTATIEITVGNEPPTLTGVTATPAAAGTGEEVEFRATGASDPDGDAIDHYEWTFGDGTAVNPGGQVVTHIYATPGTYTVSVVAVDVRGARSVAWTVEVTIAGPARTVLFAFPNPASTVATFSYFLSEGATDPVLRIYTLIGELVLEQELPAGQTTYEWNLRTNGNTQLPNGLYFCVVTVTGADSSEVFRLLIAR